MIIHHGPETTEVAEHLGFLVTFEMNDGSTIEGRVEAVDQETVSLGRTRHHTVLLSAIKRISKVSAH